MEKCLSTEKIYDGQVVKLRVDKVSLGDGRIAEREVIKEDKGEYPVLLLDDVLSELDPGRQNFVLNRISGGQVLITDCEDTQIAKRTGGKVLYVEKGKIS